VIKSNKNVILLQHLNLLSVSSAVGSEDEDDVLQVAIIASSGIFLPLELIYCTKNAIDASLYCRVNHFYLLISQ
jgi:hypothetical protein